MKYLITGGAGFIGSHLAESLIKDKHQVTIIDNLSTGSLKNIANFASSPLLDFVEGDILNLPELEYLISKADIVFHLAAAVGVELVIKDPVLTIETNVHGTERVLRSAKRKNTKVIIASTSEVYGKSTKNSFSETDDLLIGQPKNSRWAYACSKLIDEFLAMAYHRSLKMPIVITRFFNTVGPRQTGRYGMVIPRFINAALKNEDIQIYGTGEQTRCFCHVKDTVRALRLLANTPEAIGEVFNIGSTHEISINQLAKLIKDRLKSKSKLVHIPYDKAYEAGFEDMARRVPDTSKIYSLLKWEPRHSLEQIIDDIVYSIKCKK